MRKTVCSITRYADSVGLALSLLILFSFASLQPALAQILLRDINTQVSGPGPEYLVTVDDQTFFNLQNELWVTDGKLAGTRLVKTILLSGTSPESIKVENLTALDGRLLFLVSGDELIYDIWISDGTPTGTVPLINFSNPLFHSGKAVFREWSVFDDRLVFTIEGDNRLYEVWVTDGTPQGSKQLPNDVYGLATEVVDLTIAGDKLYFQSWSSEQGSLMWMLSNNESTPVRVGPVGVKLLGPVGNRLYFWSGGTVDDSDLGLWVTDGSDLGTQFVSQVYPGLDILNLSYIGEQEDNLLFRAIGQVEPWSLWISDGTKSGTRWLKEIRSRPIIDNDSNLPSWQAWSIQLSEDKLLISASDQNELGYEPWVTDGTSDGTKMVADIFPGRWPSYPDNMLTIDGIAYFAAWGGTYGRELWRTDGTTGGTWMVADISPAGADSSPRWLTETDSGILFSATDGENGRALWTSDGTESGTRMIADVFINEKTESSRIGDPVVFDKRVFFRADDGIHGSELWATQGTTESTSLFADFYAGLAGSGPVPRGISNDHLFVDAINPLYGSALWALPRGSDVFHVIPKVSRGPNIGDPVAFEKFIAFGGKTDEFGEELWISDGTPEGTRRLTDISTGPAHSGRIAIYGMIGEYIIFSAREGNSTNLYASTDQIGTTKLLSESLLGTQLVASQTVNGKILFTGPDEQLYSTDGTAEGTGLMKYFNHDGWLTGVGSYINVGNRVYFDVRDVSEDNSGIELWISDGTDEGTRLVNDINPGAGNSGPSNFFVSGDRLFFTADDGIHGRELWVSDGSESGTMLVADINPGISGSAIKQLTASSEYLFFSVDDGIHGEELWMSDGTPERTRMLVDFIPGPDGSNPSNAVLLNQELYVSFNDRALGREYFKFDVSQIPVAVESAEERPINFKLFPSYPNPFNPTTTIAFVLPKSTDVELVVYNVIGKRVKILASGFYTTGVHEIIMDASDLATGVYFYTLSAGHFSETRKMVLMK